VDVSVTEVFRLLGEPVVTSYVADPVVARGQFRLENHGDATARTAVVAAWLRVDGRRLPLGTVFPFDVREGRELDPRRLEVGPREVLTFLLGFPRVPYDERAGEVAVGLRLAGLVMPIEAESAVRLIRRIPRIS